MVLHFKCTALVLKPVRDYCCANPVWNHPMSFYRDHYHKYCPWQNQFPCFVLCGAISAKCCILPERFPLHRSLHEIKHEWKLEQEIEKRGPVVLWRPLCLLLFPLNMPVSYTLPRCMCALCNDPHSPSGGNSGQTCNAICNALLLFQRWIHSYC